LGAGLWSWGLVSQSVEDTSDGPTGPPALDELAPTTLLFGKRINVPQDTHLRVASIRCGSESGKTAPTAEIAFPGATPSTRAQTATTSAGIRHRAGSLGGYYRPAPVAAATPPAGDASIMAAITTAAIPEAFRNCSIAGIFARELHSFIDSSPNSPGRTICAELAAVGRLIGRILSGVLRSTSRRLLV
jgi:hypothetical protein